MTITTMSLASLTDAGLLAETVRAAAAERHATTELIALLAEVDARRLYLGQGYPSLFAWCIGVLRLSESAAYSRITTARAARRHPLILSRLAEGDVTLTTMTLLAAHLTDDNCEGLLDAARHRSRRDVERLVASLVRQPDVASSLRKLPSPPSSETARLIEAAAPMPPVASSPQATGTAAPVRQEQSLAARLPEGQTPARADVPAATPRALIAPLGEDRYLLKVTLRAEARARLDRARDLLRHAVPNGDPAVIIDRALKVLIDALEKSRCAAAGRPQARARATTTPRHVPASVRRAVWQRDEGRCAFVGAGGRCPETGWLELHHVVPFACGGSATVDNLELRCRAHNAYQAEQEFGEKVARAREFDDRRQRSSVRAESTARPVAPGI